VANYHSQSNIIDTLNVACSRLSVVGDERKHGQEKKMREDYREAGREKSDRLLGDKKQTSSQGMMLFMPLN